MIKKALMVVAVLGLGVAALADPIRGRLSGGASSSGGSGGGAASDGSSPAAGAGQSGFLQNSGGRLTIDAGFASTNGTLYMPSSFALFVGTPGGSLLTHSAASGWEMDWSTGAVGWAISNSDGTMSIGGALVPATNNVSTLGTDAKRWTDVRTYSFHVAGGVAVEAGSPNVISGSNSAYLNLAEASGIELVPASSGRFRAVGPTYFDGNESNASRRGTVTLSGGTGTATVNASTLCVCQDTNNAATPITRCNVTSTTLTITAALDHIVAYNCL